jgi:tellurite methyltransferase
MHADVLGPHVLDVAGGGGRNALFLARRGKRIEVIDFAFSGLHAVRQAAAAEGLDLLAIQADLHTYPLPAGRYDAVINIRYLQRSLFPALRRATKPGGLLLFETFLIDQRGIGHPKNPEFLLQRGELRAAFHDCEILTYEEGRFDDQVGRAYLARMLARCW